MKQTPTPIMSPTPGAPLASPIPMPSPMPPQLMPAPQAIPSPHAMPAPQAMPPQHQAVPQQGMPIGQATQAIPQQMASPVTQAQPIVAPVIGLEEDFSREGGDKALPQISIHAFCDRQETAAVINESSRDWRMKRTNMKIYMGGLSAAIEFYHKENTPGLVLIESGMRGPELFSQLEELASVCDAGTKVVMIGAANDIRLYRQLMDKGVSDYIVPPFHPISLIRSMGELYSDPDKPFIGRVAAFFGAKGGVCFIALIRSGPS